MLLVFSRFLLERERGRGQKRSRSRKVEVEREKNQLGDRPPPLPLHCLSPPQCSAPEVHPQLRRLVVEGGDPLAELVCVRALQGRGLAARGRGGRRSGGGRRGGIDGASSDWRRSRSRCRRRGRAGAPGNRRRLGGRGGKGRYGHFDAVEMAGTREGGVEQAGGELRKEERRKKGGFFFRFG